MITDWKPYESVLVGVFGGISIASGLYSLRKGRQTQNWSKAPGKILTSEVVHWTDSSADRMHRARVTYSYAVGGKSFEAERVRYGGVSSNIRSLHEAVVARYPPGREVDVHYDPRNPKDAVLETGSGFGGWGPIAIGAAIWVIGGYFVWFVQ